MSAITALRALLVLIALFHVVAGFGLMFSIAFQRFAVDLYGASLVWDVRTMYLLRIVGSFAFVLGSLAALAARDPLRNRIVVLALVEFFLLRDVHRHLYSQELYSGFGVRPLVNVLTTLFFGLQAALLALLLWRASRGTGSGTG